MTFPDLVTVPLVLRKIDEERIDGDVWLTYALEGAEGTQVTFQIDVSSFAEEDLPELAAALAEDLAEAITKTVRDARARVDGTN